MKFHNRVFLVIPAVILITGCGNSTSTLESSEQPSNLQEADAIKAISNSDNEYATILAKYVNSQGKVNYQTLQQNRLPLDGYNQALGAISSETYGNWDDAEKIAFLVNAYNGFTLQSIIDQSPLKESIRDIPGVWKGRKFSVASQLKTLDEIEHQILRQEFNEPRIHMALVCAAKSCPFLRNEPYTGKQLDMQLDEQTRQFLASPQGLQINKEEGRVYLSSIFNWFGKDWEKTYGIKDKFTGNSSERAVLNFISSYLDPKDREYLEQGNYKIKYLDYDWSLNSQ